MPIDAYSLCPGGTGKKIKFCCSDLLPELQKLVRMIEGDQTLAALTHAEQLLEKHPDRACLMALRASLLRSAGRVEQLGPHAARFLEAHPNNQLAWAESAMAAALTGDCRRGAECVYRAMEFVESQLYSAVYEAMGVVAQVAVFQKLWGTARGMLRLQAKVSGEAEAPRRAITQLNVQANVPILLRASAPRQEIGQDVPWLDRLTGVMGLVQQGRFCRAEEQLAALAAEVPGEPFLWQWLAELRSALADTHGEAEALRRLAALDVSWDDAVEAEARAMLISDDPLGDGVDMLRIVWAVDDVEKLQAAVSLDRRCLALPEQATQRDPDDESPPPRITFLVLDRPEAGASDEIGPHTLARPIAQARLFGKQTDREARLEVSGFLAEQRGEMESHVAALAGDALGKILEQEVIGRASRSVDLVEAEFTSPMGVNPETVRDAARQYRREAILQRWPDLSLGVLGGKSPRAVAAASPDEAQRRKLAAAVLTLESLVEADERDETFAELRSELRLPQPEPIDPEQMDIRTVPVNRLDRVLVEKLNDEDLTLAFARAASYQYLPAIRRCAAALAEREHLGASPERRHAIEQLAYAQPDLSKAMDYVELGRQACEAAGQSNVAFDFVEANLGLMHGIPHSIPQLIDHVQNTHLEEPGVRERLMELLVRMGLINPDGSPGPAALAAQQRSEMARAAGHGGVGAAAPAAEPGKLWTPESETGSGGGKLWTPD
ncbi:MAG: hypothetical protein ACOCWL_01385 [Thermoguttaceae bacterium]